MTSSIQAIAVAGFLLVFLIIAAAAVRASRRQSQPKVEIEAMSADAPDVETLAAGGQPVGYKVGAQISAGKATGYGYAEDPTGGGSIGYKGHPLRTPSDFFSGKSKYVSIALRPEFMDQLWKRGDHNLRNAPMTFSTAMDKRYAKELEAMGLVHLPLVAMDIGPGVVRQQMDVYVASKKEAFSLPGAPEVNADILVRIQQ